MFLIHTSKLFPNTNQLWCMFSVMVECRSLARSRCSSPRCGHPWCVTSCPPSWRVIRPQQVLRSGQCMVTTCRLRCFLRIVLYWHLGYLHLNALSWLSLSLSREGETAGQDFSTHLSSCLEEESTSKWRSQSRNLENYFSILYYKRLCPCVSHVMLLDHFWSKCPQPVQ